MNQAKLTPVQVDPMWLAELVVVGFCEPLHTDLHEDRRMLASSIV